MENTVLIKVEYLNNVNRENVLSFEWACENLRLSDEMCKAVEEGIRHCLIHKFDQDCFYCKDKESIVHIQFGESISRFLHNGTISLIYSEVIEPHNTGHVDHCRAKNRGKISFDIYPREHNHRFLPHVKASCGGESIRITISDNPVLVGEERFTGNNRVNEELALKYVQEKREWLMRCWNEIVESQYM